MTSSHNPLVSVVIPAYDRHAVVQRAIDSVSSQTYEHVELILVDDGSEPPLEDRVSLPENLHSATVLRHQQNQGGNAARVTGIEASSGEYVAFLDSDDRWLPEKLELQIQQLQRSGASFSCTGVRQVDEAGRVNAISEAPEAEDIPAALLRENVIGTFSSIVVSKNLISNVGLPNPELPAWQDWEWYLRLSREADFASIQEPLVVRHNEGDQISDRFEQKRDVSFPVVRNQISDQTRTSSEERVGLAGVHFRIGYAALRNGYYGRARRSFVRSMLYDPSVPKYALYLLSSGPHYKYLQSTKRRITRLRR